MNIGDIVVKINGKTFDEYVQNVKWKTGGNDESGGLRGALMYLSARPGKLMKVPEENHVTYEMQSYNDPSKKYTVTLPWIASRRDDCFSEYQQFQAEIEEFSGNIRQGRFKEQVSIPKKKPLKMDKIEVTKKIKKSLNSMKSIQLEHYKEFFFANPAAAKINFFKTIDPILKWAVYAPESKNMGILSISSFE